MISACDPYFPSVSLLLHFDGAEGSTTFIDSSLNEYSVGAYGSAQLDTTNFEFGSASLSVSGNTVNGYAYVPIVPDGPLDLSLGDFTIEFWLYQDSPIEHSNVVLSTTYGSGMYVEIDFYGNIQWNLYGSTIINGLAALTPGTWYSIALTRQGDTFTFWINGVAQNSTTASLNLGTVGQWNIGGGFSSQLQGNIDEFRITKSVARYTSNYTPMGPFGGLCAGVVPDVTGMSLSDAESAITSQGYTVGTVTSVANGVYSPGLISSQDPIGGSGLALGLPVNLDESQGATVPNVIDLALPIAKDTLSAATFAVGNITYEPSGVFIAGNVISQSPVAGTVEGGTPVSLVVSLGLPPLTVPDLFGLTQTEATNVLLELGLTPGAVGFAPSNIFPENEVMTQNPSAGQLIAPGNIVSFVISTGAPSESNLFDIEETVISQFANSPTLMQLVQNMNQYIDQSANFAAFYEYVWNVDTAQKFGLDILGKIVGVGRLLQIATTNDYVGFYIEGESQPDQDWQPMGSNQPPQPAVGGQMYTGYNATTAYLLPDNAYRQLILAKAFANICVTTAPAINQILQNLYGAGSAWVLNTGPMKISYNLSFQPSAVQLAILEQSGVIPTPPGVAVTVNANV